MSISSEANDDVDLRSVKAAHIKLMQRVTKLETLSGFYKGLMPKAK